MVGLATTRAVPLVTDGVESAVAQAAAVAGNGVVGGIAAGIVQQRVNASLLDEIVINRAVLLGEGIRAAARGQPLRGDTDSIVAVWTRGEWPIGGVALQT